MGAYVNPASTELVRSMLVEWEPLFTPALHHLQWFYPGYYACTSTSTLGPSGPNYKVVIEVEAGEHSNNTPIGLVPDHR